MRRQPYRTDRPDPLLLLVIVLGVLIVAAATAVASELVPEVRANRPLGNRLVILLDVSGSMRGVKAARAVQAVREIAEAPTDELDVAVIAFAAETQRYPATGYVKLPDALELAALQQWLSSRPIGGDTLVAPALRAASAEPADVVLVSDGIFQRENLDTTAAAWTSKRTLACYGFGSRSAQLVELARKGGGGYWRRPSAPAVVPGPWVPGWR